MSELVDLVMWTLNSEKTLARTLSSIEIAIPDKYVNQKIIVDGNSEDRTKEIGESFGWRIINTNKRGIGKQGNIALGLVETEVFASFEHDVILSPSWFTSIRPQIEKPDVAVVQGIRLPTNPVMRAIERYRIKRKRRYTSIDNNLYRTKIIKELGGFNSLYLSYVDRELRDRVEKAEYRWLVDRTVISEHIRPSLTDYVRHVDKLALLKSYPEGNQTKDNFVRLLFSPIRGLHIALDQRCPKAFLAYPYWLLWNVKTVTQIKYDFFGDEKREEK
ncbi:MAG: glycosyltransferase [Candidatus Bathyarchaeum sp.]|nr:MAG: glycosyltransferase [Candidatus Bathyarchaeum sp.]